MEKSCCHNNFFKIIRALTLKIIYDRFIYMEVPKKPFMKGRPQTNGETLKVSLKDLKQKGKEVIIYLGLFQ